MNRDDFEARVLEMWMTTRIAMTRANLQYFTGCSRKQLNRRLDELTGDGVLEVDVDDDGEMLWRVPGAARGPAGATSFADHERRGGGGRGRAAAGDDVLAAALAARGVVGGLAKRGGAALTADDGKKSALTGAALGLLGPLGWLYAGSFREALPAALIFMVVAKVLPFFLLMPLLAIALPASAIAGGLYALQYNRTGRRGTLFLDGDDATKKQPKR